MTLRLGRCSVIHMTETANIWREALNDEREITMRLAQTLGSIEARVDAGLRADPDNEALKEIKRILTEDKAA